MEPSGVPQPPQSAAYQTEGNAVTSNPAEERAAHQHGHERPVAERLPGTQSSGIKDAVPSSLGWGTHGAPAGEERFGRTPEEAGRHRELEGEQMRAAGEGQVADVVDRKPGATGSQPDLASDLDRKKNEQAEARNAIQEQRKHGLVSGDSGPQGVDTESDKMF
ncbi:hypothetical protein F5B22DRAFT_598591 [Xylaria bambusicola]|uniref:uncharacterized protein n=1 Tax=Xylaria bambusicola TaxID=326684 RepID=UPI002008CD62|nr:uncharacterized protein F5B22DRAFT_598591 [Xylaria bambusicola]KAI0520840.1 hypothetical protein F5B22DRAFT_598591 [Xylaria bambusicola]